MTTCTSSRPRGGEVVARRVDLAELDVGLEEVLRLGRVGELLQRGLAARISHREQRERGGLAHAQRLVGEELGDRIGVPGRLRVAERLGSLGAEHDIGTREMRDERVGRRGAEPACDRQHRRAAQRRRFLGIGDHVAQGLRAFLRGRVIEGGGEAFAARLTDRRLGPPRDDRGLELRRGLVLVADAARVRDRRASRSCSVPARRASDRRSDRAHRVTTGGMWQEMQVAAL